MLLVNGGEKVGSVNVRVGSCLGVSGSQDDADAVCRLLVSQWVREVLYKQVKEGLHRYEHDPNVRPVAVDCDVFVPLERLFRFWRISSSAVSFFPLGLSAIVPPPRRVLRPA